jgi:hypothetical protein
LPVLDKKLVGVWGKFRVFVAGFRQSYDFFLLPKCREVTKPKTVIEKNVLNTQEVFLEDAAEIHLG